MKYLLVTYDSNDTTVNCLIDGQKVKIADVKEHINKQLKALRLNGFNYDAGKLNVEEITLNELPSIFNG